MIDVQKLVGLMKAARETEGVQATREWSGQLGEESITHDLCRAIGKRIAEDAAGPAELECHILISLHLVEEHARHYMKMKLGEKHPDTSAFNFGAEVDRALRQIM